MDPDPPGMPSAQPAASVTHAGASGDWPPWMAPAALAGAFVMANFAALLIDLPAAALGVRVTGSHLPAGLELTDTMAQDFVFVGTALLFAGMGGRRLYSWQFGLRRAHVGRALAWLVGVLIASIVFDAVWAELAGSPHEKVLESLGANQSSLLLALSALLTCVIAPICEEFLFRGFVFQALRNWRGPWLGALLTGLLFGAFHIGSAPAVDLVPLAALGFALCFLYWRTGSLYPCIAAHALNNSIAYGSQEHWRWWQVIALVLAALALIWLLARSLKRAGVISGASEIPLAVEDA